MLYLIRLGFGLAGQFKEWKSIGKRLQRGGWEKVDNNGGHKRSDNENLLLTSIDSFLKKISKTLATEVADVNGHRSKFPKGIFFLRN